MKTGNSFYSRNGVSYLVPFALISSLFFLWGFAHSILEVLNPHFQESFKISKTMAAFVQAAVYGGYFLMALPAGYIIKRWGYRSGVITGLMLYGIGALLFIPGSYINSFPFFVFSLFVIGCGLTCLETSANPYTTVLGAPESAERRINLSQSLNGLGWIVGPLVGGALLFTGGSIAVPYTIVGVVVLLVALVFSRVRLPEIADAAEEENTSSSTGSLWNGVFVMGLVALFLYVAAQTGVNSFFINYMVENVGITHTQASQWLGFGGMGLFVVGRLSGSWLMGYIRAERLLFLYAVLATLATAVIVFGSGMTTMAAFFVVYLCESIMFPTIFSLALRSSRGHTKQASSLLIMTIVGGAVAPLLMGGIADTTGSMARAFVVPLVCYIFISIYSLCKK
ncbi:MAG: sugar MFS transporter [Bacteroidaceae bacterium]|nr:sugar MFS transporter [Bacteroidaceae bacterium]